VKKLFLTVSENKSSVVPSSPVTHAHRKLPLYKSLFTEKRKQHRRTHASVNINKTRVTTKTIKSNDTSYFLCVSFYVASYLVYDVVINKKIDKINIAKRHTSRV